MVGVLTRRDAGSDSSVTKLKEDGERGTGAILLPLPASTILPVACGKSDILLEMGLAQAAWVLGARNKTNSVSCLLYHPREGSLKHKCLHAVWILSR